MAKQKAAKGMTARKKKEITLGSVISWLKRPNRSNVGPCAHGFSRLHGELQLRADTKTPMQGPFLEWLDVNVVQLILRLKPEVGNPLVLPINKVIEIVRTDDPDWTLDCWMLETRLVDQAVHGMLPQQASDYQDATLNTRLLAKLRKHLVFHGLWGRDNSAGVHLTADEVRELIHRLPAEIDVPEGVDAQSLRLSEVVQMFDKLPPGKNSDPDVTIRMLMDHADCSRTPILNAIKGETLTKVRRGRADWYVFAELQPILRAKQNTAKFTWPSSVAGLKKTAKNS